MHKSVERAYRVLDRVEQPAPSGHGAVVVAQPGDFITEEQARLWGLLSKTQVRQAVAPTTPSRS